MAREKVLHSERRSAGALDAAWAEGRANASELAWAAARGAWSAPA